MTQWFFLQLILVAAMIGTVFGRQRLGARFVPAQALLLVAILTAAVAEWTTEGLHPVPIGLALVAIAIGIHTTMRSLRP